MRYTAKAGLGVIWHSTQLEEGTPFVRPEEVAGFRVMGFWPHNRIPDLVEFDDILALWPESSVETRSSTMHDVDNEDLRRNLKITFRIRQWPSPDLWMTAIEDTLTLVVSRGAAIAWCEAEAGILMYDSTTDFAGCCAAYTLHTGFICLGGLNDPLRFLGDDPELVVKLRSAVAQDRETGDRV